MLVKDTTHNITYFQNPSYYPPGQLNQATYGSSAKQTSIYNSRLQPCWFYATTGTALSTTTPCNGSASAANILDLKYNFGVGANDNGNVLGITNNKDSNRSVTFAYDTLNRITSAVTPNTDCSLLPSGITKNWGESFVVDPWGNLTGRTVTKCSAEPLSVTALSNNRLSGYGYDADGDVTSNGSASYTYNAESQLATTAGATYTYDGDGNRVKKSNGTLYWGTGPLLESDISGNLQREFIFVGGKRVARRDISGGAQYYYFTDHLGSSDVVTNSAGAIQNESDYYPYGGERVYSQTLASQNYKFTGKERDSESGLDSFGKRYYASTMGRWMSPDLLNVTEDRVVNPVNTLNKYIYGGNNPLKYIDPDGHDITIFYESGLPTGHVMISAYNQQTGDFAFMSVGPQQHLDPGAVLHPLSGVPGTSEYSLPTNVDDLRKNFTAVTIQTNPEVAQQAIDAIRNGAGTGNWAALGNNCTTSCVKLLKDIGLSPGSNMGLPWTPERFWENIQAKYGQSSNPFSRFLASTIGAGSFRTPKNGVDTGNPRYGMNTFDWLMLMLKAPLKACVTTYGPKGPDTTCN